MRSPAQCPPPRHPTTIWIIDDDNVESRLICEALFRNIPGVSCTTLFSADELSAAIDDPNLARPDLIILDYFLPGCEAPDVLPTLRGALDWTPIVVLSALAHTVDVRRCLEGQATLFVEKPPSYVELSSALCRISDVLLNLAKTPTDGASHR